MNRIILTLAIFFIGTSLFAQDKEKELPPEGGTPKNFTIPKKESILLNNGLELVLIPYGVLPKSNIVISTSTGNINEKENQVWLSDLMGDLMQEGSTSLSGKEIADKIAGMGGEINVRVSPHHTTVNSSVLSEFTSDAILLMGDILKNPAFPEAELSRLKENMKRNLTVALSRPGAQASNAFFATMYPDHPYGRVYATTEMIDSFTLDNVKQFYKENIGAQRTTVYVSGKFNKNKVMETVKSLFSDWAKGPEKNYPIATPNTESQVQIIDRPDAPQTTLYYGLPVIDPSHPDFIALDVTNTLLGGSFGSRITSNIREDKGYTYSPRSSLRNNAKSSIWLEIADVTSEHTGASITEINKEIKKLQEEPPSKEELDGIKNYEAGTFVLSNSSPRGIINQLLFLDTHGLDDTYLENWVKNVYQVTPEQIQEMTKKYITPEKMTLVAVGDRKTIDKQIQQTVQKEALKQ